MSRRVPTPEQLDSLRDTFRKQPPSTPRDFKAAGVRAGVTQAVATRAYTRGWPGIESIESQLTRERALQAQNAEVLTAKRLVASVKTSAAVLDNALRRLHLVMPVLTAQIAEHLEADLSIMRTEAGVKLLHRIAKVYKDVAAITAKGVELDRLLAGEATSIVGVKQIEADQPVDLEKAQAVSEQLARALRRAGVTPPAAEPATETKATPDVDTRIN